MLPQPECDERPQQTTDFGEALTAIHAPGLSSIVHQTAREKPECQATESKHPPYRDPVTTELYSGC